MSRWDWGMAGERTIVGLRAVREVLLDGERHKQQELIGLATHDLAERTVRNMLHFLRRDKYISYVKAGSVKLADRGWTEWPRVEQVETSNV